VLSTSRKLLQLERNALEAKRDIGAEIIESVKT
jgi:hypothetical protein